MRVKFQHDALKARMRVPRFYDIKERYIKMEYKM